MKNNILKNNKGMSLIEMIVSIAIFSGIILMTTGVFKSVIEGQRNAIAAQNTQESMRYAFEVMSKEIRMAQKSNNTCDAILGISATYKVLNTSVALDELYLKNKDGFCVKYFLENDGGVSRLKILRDDGAGATELFITPNEISVTGLEFDYFDDAIGAFHSVQPLVTIKMVAEMAAGKAMHKHTMTMQTTVSSRYYE